MASFGGSPREGAASLTDLLATILRREQSKDCSPQPGINLCEKPGIASSTVAWIIVGSVLGVLLVGTLSVMFFFHLRRKERDMREDMEDRFQMSDYGLEEPSAAARKPRKDVSPYGDGRRSRDPLHAGAEPQYHGSHSNGRLDPFDDTASSKSGNGSSYPPSNHKNR